MTPQTWEEAARDAGAFIHARPFTQRDRDLFNLFYPSCVRLAECIDILREHGPEYGQQVVYWETGSIALQAYCYETDQQPARAFEHILAVIAAKQHDYGTDNITVEGHVGLRVRMHDKVARLRQLHRRRVRGEQPKNEAIADTLLDLVGYSIIGIMLLDGTFELPLAADQ